MKVIINILICSLVFKCYGEEYKNLVFEGAGIKGIAYVGVIDELEERGVIPTIENVAGTSAGAITALAVSLGYTSDELKEIMYNTEFQKFNDGKYIFLGGIYRSATKYGWYEGEEFSNWLEEIIAKKTGNPNITFKELHDRKFRDLYVTGTCLNRQKLIVFSYKSYPDMKVKDAIRASMSVPLYYEAVFIDSVGSIIEDPEENEKFDIIVDGGIIGNFPIDIFDSTSSGKDENLRIANKQTIGVRIDTEHQIEYDKRHEGLAPVEIDDFRSYMIAFYNYIIENLNRNLLTAEDWNRTISVNSADIGPKVKKLTKEQKDLLVNNGREAVKLFFSGK